MNNQDGSGQMGEQKRNLSKKTTDIARPYKLTSEEWAAREAVQASRGKKVPRVKVTMKESESKVLMADWELDHPHQGVGHHLLMRALGTWEPGIVCIPLWERNNGACCPEPWTKLDRDRVMGIHQACRPKINSDEKFRPTPAV